MFGNFGATAAPSFGGGAFSSPTQNASVFGQPQQPAASSSLFGGGFNQAKPTFGTSFGSPQTQSTMFGQQNRLPVPNTGGLFSGQTAAVSPFSATGQTQVAGTSIPFNAITGNDTMMKNGVASPISTRHQCITCMKEYENKSLEELRLEDYQLNRKGPSQGSMFGAQQPQQQSTGLFSSIGASTASAPFGQTTTFGANTTGGGLFSSLTAPKPASSFFSSPATSTSAFGTNSSFSFNSPTSQPGSMFGSTNNPVSTGGGLGANSSFTFGQPQGQQQQQQTGGLFSQKPLSTTTTSGFGAFGASTLTPATNANKPLGFGFGSPAAPTFGSTPTTGFGTGTGSLFGAQTQQPQQNKPFSFASPFSSQAQPTQPTFGSTTGTTGFSFAPTTSTPSLNFGAGTNTSVGGFGGATANTFGTPPSFSLGGGQSFGNSGFGLNTMTTPGFSSFAPTTGFSQNNTFAQQSAAAPPAGPISFATTPYKDSPLFYNLIANRNLEDMIKPTSPAAQRAIKEASRRRTSTSVSVSTAPNRNLTFPISKPRSFNKQSIFDGFEEEDRGITMDILSPKTSVKKLTLKNFRNTSVPSHRHSISFSPSSRLTATFNNGLNDSTSSDLDSNRINDSSIGGVSSNRSKTNIDLSRSTPDSECLSSQSISGQKRSSDADRSVLNGVDETKGCRVINTRGGYYVNPPIEALDQMVDEEGNCFVKGLTIGRQNHGEIHFLDAVNVAGINIDEIVHFRHKEVVVYPDDINKPPLGEGLNCPAEVTLERVWPIDKVTMDPIKSPQKLQTMGYEDTLRRACVRLGAEFISYAPEMGTWRFKVAHFSKYSCEVEESEDNGKADATAPIKGLGGIPIHQTQSGFIQKSLVGQMQLDHFNAESSQQWRNHPVEIDESEPTPLIRSRIGAHAQSTPLVHVSNTDDFSCGDVEHNPLTPSESNDSDLDWGQASGRGGINQLYESVLKEKSDTNTVRMMRSVLMDYETGDGDISDFQPPSKKSRAPGLRASEIGNRSIDLKISDAKQRKSLMVLKSQQVGPNISSLIPSGISGVEERRKESSALVPGYVTSIKKKEIRARKKSDRSLFTESNSVCRIRPVSRVSFGSMGCFITVMNVNGSTPVVKINKIHSYARKPFSSPLYMEVLEKQMELQLENEERSLISDHIDLLWSVRCSSYDENPFKTTLDNEMMMWELCQILWPLKETNEVHLWDIGFTTKQRKDLSDWFIKHGKQLFADKINIKNPTILGLLKMGQKKEACALAVKQRNYTMALCLAQRPLAKKTNSNCKEQLEIWEKNGGLRFLSDETIKVYRLCCGEAIFEADDICNMSPADWLQNFALYLWYSCPPHLSVDKTVKLFQSFLKTQTCSVDCAFPAKEESCVPNLCIKLLKLYSFVGYPLNDLLDPRTSNSDCLEYKLSWLLMTNLEKFGYLCSPELRRSIITAFAGQLEQIGLFQWATYVLSHMPKTVFSKVFIQRILERNTGLWKDPGQEAFLSRRLAIPHKTIFAAKTLRASIERRKDRLIWYLLKAGVHQKAFNELLSYLSIDSVNCTRSMQAMLKILEALKPYSNEIRGWYAHGLFLLDYLKLMVARSTKNVRSDQVVESGNSLYGFESGIASFVNCFVHFEPKNEDECALLLELVLSTQKIVAVLMESSPEFVNPTPTDDRVGALLDICIPKEYMEELQYFLTFFLTN